MINRKNRAIAISYATVLTLIMGVYLAATQAYALTDRATKAGLVPHKALYEIELLTNKSSTQFVNLSGQMYYDWQPSCEAWVSNHRFNLMYEYADAPAMRITSDFSTYESFDGKTMNYTSQRKRDGHIFEEIRGMAKVGDDKRASKAEYSIPKDLEFQLPAETKFPMSHTLAVLDKIRNGQKFYRTTIFDGSDKDGPLQVTSFIGKPVEKADVIKIATGTDNKLLDSQAWNMRLAFFPLNSPDAASDYEMSVVFHENGVISDVTIDYKDFSVRQKLVALEKLEDICGKPEAKQE